MDMKLLIVEDNAAVRRVIREMVADLADEIVECIDGADAFEAYTQFHPDWVLMDVAMKRVNGIAATSQIKEAFPEANIVIVTNHDDSSLREAATRAGAGGYVLKEDMLALREIILRAN